MRIIIVCNCINIVLKMQISSLVEIQLYNLKYCFILNLLSHEVKLNNDNYSISNFLPFFCARIREKFDNCRVYKYFKFNTNAKTA